MDIQKLEQIVLTDVKMDAQNLIKQTRVDADKWLLEQTKLAGEIHQDEINRIKTDHQSKMSILKVTLAADFHKNIGRLKKDKITTLKKELLNTLLTKIKNSPDWILEKAFLGLPVKSGQIMVSDDISSSLTQEKVELFLKKHPSFTWGGIDKMMVSSISIECNTVRYLFPLQEMVDEFVDSNSDQIVSLLFP
jgi:hypothetical protein